MDDEFGLSFVAKGIFIVFALIILITFMNGPNPYYIRCLEVADTVDLVKECEGLK